MINFVVRGITVSAQPEIDPDEIDRILAEGATLPAVFYTDPTIAELEDELIFRPSWQIVGVEPELRNVGDYFTTEISGYGFAVPIVVLRDEEMQLRAFVNVCRHRAHFVVVGSGNRKIAPMHLPRLGLRAERLPAGRPALERGRPPALRAARPRTRSRSTPGRDTSSSR